MQSVLNGKALWSAIKERKESENKLNAMNNHIRKLEFDQFKMSKSLYIISNKSQKLLKYRKDYKEV